MLINFFYKRTILSSFSSTISIIIQILIIIIVSISISITISISIQISIKFFIERPRRIKSIKKKKIFIISENERERRGEITRKKITLKKRDKIISKKREKAILI